MSSSYDAAFYRSQADASQQSATAFLETLIRFGRPRSVVDVGCGAGTWLAAWEALGVDDLEGFDGNWVESGTLRIDPSKFTPLDLAAPFPARRRFDLAMSLEVAEHLPLESATDFVRSIGALSDVVLFSAAIPYQGGADHVNEQWPAFWSEAWAELGFSCYDVMRPLVWRDERIDWWYRQNTLLFVKQESEDTFARVVSKELGPPTGEPMALVHPEAFVHFATYADTRRVVRALPRIASRMARNRTAAVRNRINTSRT